MVNINAPGERVSVIVLWGKHRKPDAQSRYSTPANVDKGIREFEQRGLKIAHVYFRPGAANKGSGLNRVSRYVDLARSALDLYIAARRTGAPLYTTDFSWAAYAARLKKAGLIRNRLIFRWAGHDTDVASLKGGASEARRTRTILAHADVCLFASALLTRTLREALPTYADKMQFWPTGVDTNFYAHFVGGEAGTGDPADIVAVGTDSKRDWKLPLDLARAGLRVTLLTENRAVAEMLAGVERDIARNVSLRVGLGFVESAKIMAAARCLLISTLPNSRFSGSTTVGVAAALGKPLMLDDPHELAGYGLQPGRNCELFGRSDPPSAIQAARRILSDPGYAASLGEEIHKLAPQLDISRYALMVERALRPDWVKTDFTPA